MARNDWDYLHLGEDELFAHTAADLAEYDTFFEFVIANPEMAGRVDALHSQHVRGGAKQDVLCVRSVDMWGERTYPVHRGRPTGRFISKLVSEEAGISGRPRRELTVSDVGPDYEQRLDPSTGVLSTSFSWSISDGGRESSRGMSSARGFMHADSVHVMAHRFRDRVTAAGVSRTFGIQTVFPYHSRASAFYIKKPYSPKSWAWGEVEHLTEFMPENNASVSVDRQTGVAVVSFATLHQPHATRVVWVLVPLEAPDGVFVDEETGGVELAWSLSPGKERRADVVVCAMTDRDLVRPPIGDRPAGSVDDPALKEKLEATARALAEEAAGVGYEQLEAQHTQAFVSRLDASQVHLPDQRLQQLHDVSRYYLQNSVGGSYCGFIGTDNVIYETCMCDNLVTLAALVESGNLAETEAELRLLHRYLPAAQANASERMAVVLGDANAASGAALLPFYMTEDGRELWQDNVFGMYTSMSAFHTLALVKTAAYTDDSDFLREVAYPWVRGYAEYGRLHAVFDATRDGYVLPVGHVGGGGEGQWYMHTMAQDLYCRGFTRLDPPFRYADFSPIEYFPAEAIATLPSNWIDSVLSFRYILETAAELAAKLDQDAELRVQWAELAAGLIIPQDERFLRSHIDSDANPSIGGTAVGNIYWPAERGPTWVDEQKLDRTFDELHARRLVEGLASHPGRGWDAVWCLAYAYRGRAEEALAALNAFAIASDRRGIQMRESARNRNFYYLLNYGTLVLLTRTMLLQTFDRQIRVFPAVPRQWRDGGVAFERLPAEGGRRISASTRAGRTEVTITAASGATSARLAGSFSTVNLRITPAGIVVESCDGEIDSAHGLRLE